jgi:hypothetical protein
MRVLIRATLLLSTSARRIGEIAERVAALRATPDFGAIGASLKEFHASHDGHRPSQRADSKPQAEQ